MALAVPEGAAVGGVRDAAAGAVGVGDLRDHTADAGEHVRERRDVRGIVGIGERAGMRGVERVAARLAEPAAASASMMPATACCSSHSCA